MISRREFIAGTIALGGCAGSPSPPNIAEPIPPPVTTPLPMANNQLLASDNFASGSLAAGWSPIFSQSVGVVVNVPPNVVQPSGLATPGRQMWTGLTWPNDQVSEITINSLTAENGTQAELWLRMQSGAYSGYLVTIGALAPTTAIFRNDAGTFTQLATVSITIAAGDVWTFAAVGSVLTLYQNYTPVLRWMDATYTSGSPGFGVQSSVNVTHVRVGSWRGYNAIQQDGIWQKQGCLSGLAPLAGDFSAGVGGIANATMLFEGNAQILSGTVYKMWFSAGASGAGSNTYYAESTDGKVWTRLGSAVITGQGFPFIIKSGSTYYLYTQPTASAGAGNFSVYTSSNGTTWTSQATNILGVLGGAGVWDGVVQWYFQPLAILAGTWYGVYSGANSSASAQLKIGLATAPDGITWTKSGSNPVLTAANGGSVVNSSAVAIVGGTYYMWMFGSIPGRGGTPTLLNPGEGVLYSTTPNFTAWNFVHHSAHQSELYEGVNYATGQCYPNSIFTVGKQTFMYIQAATSDAVAPAEYQLSLAIANAPISSIVTVSEDGTASVATDAFARSAGGLGANWTTVTGVQAPQIVSSGVVGAQTLTTVAQAAYTGSVAPNDQYSEVTVLAMTTSSNHIDACVRMSTAAATCYLFDIAGPTNASSSLKIFVEVSGVFTQIGPTQTIIPQVGDVFRMQVNGFVLSAFQNGFLILQVQDLNQTIASGSPGIRLGPDNVSLANCQISAWRGGNANVSPFAGGGGGDLGPGYDFFYRF